MIPADDEPLLRAERLAVTYPGEVRALPSGVSFTVTPGEVVLVLGPSGSGKSTLALTLNGLIPHALDADVTGAVFVSGRDAAEAAPAELSTRVGMVFQDPDAQIVTGSVFDEVAFALENLCLPVDEILVRSEHSLRSMGLWDRRNDDPDVLSGGGRQRLALACALAADVSVLVLDEPTANLDPAGVTDVYRALHDLAASGERSIVLVEHNLDAAVSLATRVVVLDGDGRLVHDGPTADVLRTHARDLLRMGVWLPHALLAALRLREAGWRMGPLPLTADELAAGLAAEPPPVGAGGASPVPAVTVGDGRTGVDEASAIRVRGLSLVRGGRAVLDDVELDIPRGSFTAVVGPNGAGKTTLAQAIAGVLPPPAGAVTACGLDPALASSRELSARIGFVFQNPEHQFIAHTVFDELAHGLRVRRVPEHEVRERVTTLAERFGLTEHLDSHPFRLSGGQKRRLSVGTALIVRPDALVLDEPTFGQDRARAEELLSLLSALHTEGTTVVIVTHDLELVSRYATHVAVVAGGRLHRYSSPAEVFGDDALLAVAGIGRPALLDALAGHPEAAAALGRSAAPGSAAATRGAVGRAAQQQREAGADAVSTRWPTLDREPVTDGSRGPRPTDDPAAPSPAASPAAAAAVPPRRIPFLHGINPLAKLAAVVPPLAVLLFTRDLVTPAAFIALAYGLLFAGARLTRRTAAMLALVLPAMVAAIGAGFTLWADPAAVADSPVVVSIGGWSLHAGALEVGFATGLRLASLLALALVGGATTEGADLVRAAIRQLRLPYRIGYAALASYRFVPRFRHELEVIRSAHRVRGRHGGRGPLASLGRGLGYAVPLLAGAIRHAERVALAMDARAFGAFPTRTERHVVPWRRRDTAFVLALWAASAVLFALTRPFG